MSIREPRISERKWHRTSACPRTSGRGLKESAAFRAGKNPPILSLDDGVPLLDCRVRGKECWRTRVSLHEEKKNNQTAEESRQRHVLFEEGREARAGNAAKQCSSLREEAQ